MKHHQPLPARVLLSQFQQLDHVYNERGAPQWWNVGWKKNISYSYIYHKHP